MLQIEFAISRGYNGRHGVIVSQSRKVETLAPAPSLPSREAKLDSSQPGTIPGAAAGAERRFGLWLRFCTPECLAPASGGVASLSRPWFAPLGLVAVRRSPTRAATGTRVALLATLRTPERTGGDSSIARGSSGYFFSVGSVVTLPVGLTNNPRALKPAGPSISTLPRLP